MTTGSPRSVAGGRGRGIYSKLKSVTNWKGSARQRQQQRQPLRQRMCVCKRMQSESRMPLTKVKKQKHNIRTCTHTHTHTHTHSSIKIRREKQLKAEMQIWLPASAARANNSTRIWILNLYSEFETSAPATPSSQDVYRLNAQVLIVL